MFEVRGFLHSRAPLEVTDLADSRGGGTGQARRGHSLFRSVQVRGHMDL